MKIPQFLLPPIFVLISIHYSENFRIRHIVLLSSPDGVCHSVIMKAVDIYESTLVENGFSMRRLPFTSSSHQYLSFLSLVRCFSFRNFLLLSFFYLFSVFPIISLHNLLRCFPFVLCSLVLSNVLDVDARPINLCSDIFTHWVHVFLSSIGRASYTW